MNQIKHTPNRKARKVHTCDLCHGKIEIGEEYDYQFNSDGGDSWEFKSHIKCYNLAVKLEADNGEGFDQESMANCICDELAHFIKDEGEFDTATDKPMCDQINMLLDFYENQDQTGKE